MDKITQIPVPNPNSKALQEFAENHIAQVTKQVRLVEELREALRQEVAMQETIQLQVIQASSLPIPENLSTIGFKDYIALIENVILTHLLSVKDSDVKTVTNLLSHIDTKGQLENEEGFREVLRRSIMSILGTINGKNPYSYEFPQNQFGLTYASRISFVPDQENNMGLRQGDTIILSYDGEYITSFNPRQHGSTYSRRIASIEREIQAGIRTITA